MKQFNTCLDIKIGQYLVIASLIGVMLSPPIANVFIGLTLIWTLAFKKLIQRAKKFLLTKVGLLFLIFVGLIVSAPTYSIASESTVLSSIWGWRKLLMLPLATIYFYNQPNSQSFAIKIFLIFCIIFAAGSFLNLFFYNGKGILIRNYVTQGLFFSIGTLICLSKFIHSKTFRHKFFYFLIGLVFVSNIIAISWGRSGYIALIVMLACYLLMSPNINWRKKLWLIASFTTVICALLALTPQSRERIELLYSEAQSGNNEAELTSIGVRITFWKNTFEIVKKPSILGVGTGGFEDVYKKQVKDKPGFEGLVTGDPHNQYLKILVEQGILGLMVFILLLGSVLLNKNSENINHIIGKSVLIAWCITSLANSHFSTFNEGQFIWIWIGIFLTSNIIKNQNQTIYNKDQ